MVFKTRFSGDSQSLYWIPRLGNLIWVQNLHNSGRISLVLLFFSLWIAYLAGMGLYFIIIVPLLPSCCGFFFVFGDRLSFFLVGSSIILGFPAGSAGKESTCNSGDLGLVPGLGRSPGERKGYPLQYSGLENYIDCIVHGVAKSRTRLSEFHFTSL